MADQPDQFDHKAIPDNAALPMRAAQPRALDWNNKTGLTPVQLTLLAMFKQLSYARKAELTHGLTEKDSIPAHKIKMLYMQQQAEKQKGADADALKDTTESDLA